MIDMAPEISIIIPVYNVEPYLRQCLDSVVNQTLRDIQILCVNDGSTDGSLSILQEYARNDSRVLVIDQPNSGCPGMARNAALPHIRGKYVDFLDSDDWMEPTLCEKAYYRLESTGADVVFFFERQIIEKERENRPANTLAYCQWPVASVASALYDFHCCPWNRVIRTSFFQKIGARFPETFLPEDLYLHWVLLANEPRVEIIFEKLYNYRLHKESVTGQCGEYAAKNCLAFSLVKDYLQSVGKYEQYQTLFLKEKFSKFSYHYSKLRKSIRPDAIRWFRESLDDEEMNFLRNDKSLKPRIRDSILFLIGSKLPGWKSLWRAWNELYLRGIIKAIGRFMKFPKIMPQNSDLFESRIRELSELIAQRDRIIARLRNHQDSPEFQVSGP